MTTLKFKKFNIDAYKPGKSSIRNLTEVIKLSANESALGVSAKVKKIISQKNLKFFLFPVTRIVKKELRPNNNVQKIRFK